jgi:hypothetical protein
MTFADTGAAAFPLLDPEGEKDALRAKVGGFSEGSDHQIWAEGSWRVPVIYVADWPDRYIHTDRDLPANIDPTKVKRAMFIAAASAWYLANLDRNDDERLAGAMHAESLERRAANARRVEAMRAGGAAREDVGNLQRHDSVYEYDLQDSVARFGLESLAPPRAMDSNLYPVPAAVPGDDIVYRRVASLKGPMDGFGYSWLDDHLKQAGIAKPALLARESDRDGPSFGYETPNLVDGKRSVRQIRDDLAATVGPVPVEEVAQYLAVLERLGVIERSPR